MTALELRAYILKHMSAEDALLKLLELQCDQYDKLKLGEPLEPIPGQGINPLMILACAALDLGWDMILTGKGQEQVTGLICGTREYIDDVAKKLDK